MIQSAPRRSPSARRRVVGVLVTGAALLASASLVSVATIDTENGGSADPAEAGRSHAEEPPTPAPTPPLGAPRTDGEPADGGIEAAPTAPTTQRPGDVVREEADQAEVPVNDGPFPGSSEQASGALVATYPTDVLPLAPGSTVQTSSVSTSTERIQVAVVAENDALADVLAFYLQELGRQGFVEVPLAQLPGQAGVGLRRDASSVAVSTEPESGTFTVLATLYREDD